MNTVFKPRPGEPHIAEPHQVQGSYVPFQRSQHREQSQSRQEKNKNKNNYQLKAIFTGKVAGKWMTLNDPILPHSTTRVLAMKHMCYPTQRDQVKGYFWQYFICFHHAHRAHVQKYLNWIQISQELLDVDFGSHSQAPKMIIFEMAAMPFPCNGLMLCCVNLP